MGAEQADWISVSDYLPEEGTDVLVMQWDDSVAIYHLKMCACTDVPSGESYLRPYWYPGGLPTVNSKAWKYSSDFAAKGDNER